MPGETFQKLLRAQSRRRDWEGGAGVGGRASHSDNPGLESPESPGLTPVLRPAHLLWLCIRPVHGPTIHARPAPHLEPSRSEDGVGCPVSLTQRVRLQGLLASLEAQGPWEALGEVSAGWMVAPVFLWKERLSSLAHSGQWAALGPCLGAREASRVWTPKQGAPRPTEEVWPLVLEAAPLGGGQVSSHQTWLSIFLLVYAPVPASSPRNQVWLLSGTQRAWLGLAGFSIPWGSRRPGAAPSDGWPGPWGVWDAAWLGGPLSWADPLRGVGAAASEDPTPARPKERAGLHPQGHPTPPCPSSACQGCAHCRGGGR